MIFESLRTSLSMARDIPSHSALASNHQTCPLRVSTLNSVLHGTQLSNQVYTCCKKRVLPKSRSLRFVAARYDMS